VNELNFIALKIDISLMTEEKNNFKCREMKSKFKKREKGCGRVS